MINGCIIKSLPSTLTLPIVCLTTPNYKSRAGFCSLHVTQVTELNEVTSNSIPSFYFNQNYYIIKGPYNGRRKPVETRSFSKQCNLRMALDLILQHLGHISPMKKVDSSPRTPEQHRTRMSLPST
jgi:hypothetical protein